MKKSYISPFLMLVVLLCTLNTKAQLTQQCILPDNGSGTAALPPIGCEYTCSSEPFYIIDGLPAGTTIEFWGTLNNFVCCPWGCDLCTMPIPPGECEAPGGTMGGDGHCFEAVLEFEVIGTGALAGFQRTLQLPVFGEVHTGPRIAGEPVQEFLTLFYQLTGLLYGDPDFCSLNLVAGENYGLPSPGQTILTSNGPESWWVESFFDITYQIEFEGCPGSMLEGFSGITTGTTRIETGENGGGSNVSDLFLRVGDWVIDEDWHNWIGPDPVELQLFVNDPEHIIAKVNFYYSLDGIAWTYIGTDDDGSQPEISTTECTVNDGDGWQISWYPEGLPPDDLVVYLMAEAVTQDGTTYEVTNSKKYDPTPPNGINTNMTDWLITTDDFILLEVEPGTCEDLDYIWVEIVPKADSFQKGIPPISQQPHSSSHCSPTAAAACLKYFEGEGDTTIAGGLSDYDLVDALAGRFHTNDGHWGTYLSDIANGLRSWINDHGGGYTVRGPMDYDWETMRNELERCQDVMSSIYWDGGCGHSMTFNSIINTPNPDGSIRVDFMDPWTGEIEWGDMNTGTGHVSGFTGAGASGTMGDMIIVCPEEPSVTPGGGTIFPWPYPGGITIPFPGDGLFFLRIIAVDAKGHAARHDYVVKKETASLVSDPVLCIDDYINPEPWNDWFGVDNNDLPVVFLVSDPQNEITHVDFFYSLD
nr:hypothetical protein [Bacteroidota bacterium]